MAIPISPVVKVICAIVFHGYCVCCVSLSGDGKGRVSRLYRSSSRLDRRIHVKEGAACGICVHGETVQAVCRPVERVYPCVAVYSYGCCPACAPTLPVVKKDTVGCKVVARNRVRATFGGSKD